MTTATKNIIRLPQVINKTGISRSQIYSLLARGEFPKKIQLSTRGIGFLESEVDAWIAEKAAKRATSHKKQHRNSTSYDTVESSKGGVIFTDREAKWNFHCNRAIAVLNVLNLLIQILINLIPG
jgi:prophage regulatory protein